MGWVRIRIRIMVRIRIRVRIRVRVRRVFKVIPKKAYLITTGLYK